MSERLIERTAPKRPDRLTIERVDKYQVRITLTTGQLFDLLGVPRPPADTQVHVLLARSHGNEGSFYRLDDSLLVEVRLLWEIAEAAP